MFRDLKEYQNLQELYEEKVSKVENINEENVRGANMKGSVNVGNMFKKIGDALKPKPIVRPEGTTSVRQSGVNTVNTNKNVKVDRSRNIPVMDGPVNNPEYGKNMSRSKEDLNPSKVDTSNEIESDANYAKNTISYELFKTSALSEKEIREAFEHAKNIGIDIFSTVGDIPTAKLIKKLKPAAWKISSSLLTHIPLIKYLSKTKQIIYYISIIITKL